MSPSSASTTGLAANDPATERDTATQLHPRAYKSHRYYVVELPETAEHAEAKAAAASLGAELVQPLGELAGHWLVRGQKGLPTVFENAPHALSRRNLLGDDSDPIMQRWKQLRRRAVPRSLGSDSSLVRKVTPLALRKRAQRVPPPLPPRRLQGRDMSDWDTARAVNGTQELLHFQNDMGMNDPLLPKQWHLANVEDGRWELNITNVWDQGITGKGINVVMVDDGVDMTHPDLKDNYNAEGSYDFNDHDDEPAPVLSDDAHGTRCAGEISAVPGNNVCGVGVAYQSKIAGVRILSGPITDADEASALNYKYQVNDIYSCSWGPPDDGKTMEGPSDLILKSMVNGVQKGRGGKGSIFVFAAGNGGGVFDQCNFDGYTNSIFSVTVGAFDYKGIHPFYSERCAAMLVVTPSSGSGNHIHTTDRGDGRCTDSHGGTSAAAPLASAVFALVLEVRPDLGWRDIQHLAVNTAVQLNAHDDSWEKNGAGRYYSYRWGYGQLNAGLIVDAARNWKVVKPQAWFDTPTIELPTTDAPTHPTRPSDFKSKRQETPPEPITQPDLGPPPPGIPLAQDVPPPGPPIPPEQEEEPAASEVGTFITEGGVTSEYEVTKEMLEDSNFERLEHITVRVWIDHGRRGDVGVYITSPQGTTSMLASPRRFDVASTGFDGWRFMSMKHWDEDPVGTWTINVTHTPSDERDVTTGRFKQWSLQLWGESIDAAKAEPWHIPEEGEEDEEEVGSYPQSTFTHRPKPTEHPIAPGVDPTSLEVGPTDTPDGAQEAIATSGTALGGADEGIFEGMDALRKHSAWLGVAFLIILGCGLGLGAWFLIRQRRRKDRLRFGRGESSRGGYAPVADEEVPLGVIERSARRLGIRREQRSAAESKELYDAFGDGPSDDESDLDANETTGLTYHEKFLEDDEDDHEHGMPVASGSGSGSGTTGAAPATEYRDDDEDDQPPREEEPARSSNSSQEQLVESNPSTSSWQDAEEGRHY